ncbi:MAG: sigma-70 family RNA polymerase sigma factor [Acidobacteria bacterium]|nr:sigma-70 family RNA polymerase sigma factor [Acidobacteriota bacterium]
MLTISIVLEAVKTRPKRGGSPGTSASTTLTESEFEQLYVTWAGPLFGYLNRMTGDHTLAEDLAQKAFVRLLGATLKTKDEPVLKSYLYRIATNLVYDHWRRDRSESSFDDVAPIPMADSATPLLRTDMQRLFEELEPKERALLWLAHVEDAPHREIAEILEIREKSVRVMLFRARKKFAGVLQANGYGVES